MAAPEPREKTDEDPLEASRMTLGEHLEELRTRLFRSVVALVLATVGCWLFHEEIAAITLRPLHLATAWLNEDLVEIHEQRLAAHPELSRSEYFRSDDPGDRRLLDPIRNPRGDGAQSGFVFYLKVCLYFGFFLSGTYILWQLWLFIAAGLYPRERKAVHRYFPLSAGLFVAGILFGYFVMVPYAYYFLTRMSLEQIRLDPRLEVYFGFLKSLSLALGIVFQLPVVMLALARLDLVRPETFSKHRRYMLLGALVAAAILTPPDPFTQMMMAVPIVALYELGIVLARAAYKKARAEVPAGVGAP